MPTAWDEFEPVTEAQQTDWSGFELVSVEDQKKELDRQMAKARLEGKQGEMEQAAADLAQRAAYTLSLPAQPLVRIPRSAGTGAGAGLLNVAAGAAEGMSAPAYWFAPGSQAVRLAAASQMLGNLPQSVPNAVQTIQSPDATMAQKVEAGAAPVLESAFGAGMAGVPLPRLPRRPIEPPAVLGSTLQMPSVARPVAESAQFPGPAANRPPEPAPVGRPAVPETPAQPRLTEVEEVRQSGADTIAKIQALFPKAELSREQARSVGKRAWGQNWPEQPTPKPANVTGPEAPQPPATGLGTWSAEDWTLEALKGQSLAERQNKARYLGLRNTEGQLETGFKKLSDAGKARLDQLEAERAAKTPPPPPEPPAPAAEAVPKPPAPPPAAPGAASGPPPAPPGPSATVKALTAKPLEDVTHQDISGMSTADAAEYFRTVKSPQKGAVMAGLKLTEKDVPELERLQKGSGQKTMEAIKANDNDTVMAEMGRNVWYSAAIEGAKKAGPNYDALMRQRAEALSSPAKSETVAEAVPEKAAETGAQQAQSAISKTVTTEGVTSGKEAKSKLVETIQKQIEDAPSERNFPGVIKAREEENTSPDFWDKAKAEIGMVIIEIPGDGTFKVLNTKEALGEVLKRAKSISTKSTEPVKVTRRGMSAEDKAWVEEQQRQQTEPGEKPQIISMGGMAPGDPGEAAGKGGTGQDIYGIAQAVREQRAQAGAGPDIQPGQGVSDAEAVQHGRSILLKDPLAAQKAADAFQKTKAVSYDGMAVVRAKGEEAWQAARKIEEKFGTDTPEYRNAFENAARWDQASKGMQTEWHKTGQAQQGYTDIDTGSFTGLQRAHRDATSQDFTPGQAKAAEKIAKGVKKATDEADAAKAETLKKMDEEMAKTPAKPAPTQPKPGKATPSTKPAEPDAKTLWKRAKVMLEGGETDFDNIRSKLAIEFGIPIKRVTELLTESKGAKRVTEEMYQKMAKQRRLVTAAKNWLKDQSTPGWLKFARAVPRVFFIDKILGHGTVGMVTHAGINIFNPGAWRTYWPNFLRQYKLLGWHDQGAYHERMMQDLVRDPLYVTARRAGLANDPVRYHDDYQNSSMVKWLGKFGLTGNRGFDALKLFRQARFNQLWNSAAPKMQTPAYAKILADSVNHASGVVNMPFREWANWTFFAPKLESARWAWMFKDPAIAAKTFAGWRTATPEARQFAMSELKQKAAIAGTYYGLLALNQGILAANGSDQKVNLTNPRRADFMAFKVAGHNLGVVGPMLGMVRLFVNLAHAAGGKRGQVESLTPRAEEFGQIAEEYTRGKLSPFAGTVMDFASQSDFQGRPLPFSTDRVPAHLRRQRIGAYTWPEYLSTQFTPIPASEAIREVWRDQGMTEDQMQLYAKALGIGFVMGSTGARLSLDVPRRETK